MGVPPEQMFTKAPGFSSFGGGPSSAPSAAAAEPVKVKEAFDLKLTEASAAAKIKIIKEVRAITGLGLKEVSCRRFPDLFSDHYYYGRFSCI